MILWIDAQISPALAPWVAERFGIEAYSVKWLGLRDAEDAEIFAAAREANATIMTKDIDFVHLVQKFGPRSWAAPPSSSARACPSRP
ncbi:MAG TPA: DUF5615 family PIN-like protein [Longimicrobium sp.]|nr:DUF5615 family PIN-like protein [Longimicrobium sp.]